MKSIIISGGQGSGKSKLAEIISEPYQTVVFKGNINIKELKETTECIIIEEVFSKSEFAMFKEYSTRTHIQVDILLSGKVVYCKPKLVICVTQLKFERQNVRHSTLFNLF